MFKIIFLDAEAKQQQRDEICHEIKSQSLSELIYHFCGGIEKTVLSSNSNKDFSELSRIFLEISIWQVGNKNKKRPDTLIASWDSIKI